MLLPADDGFEIELVSDMIAAAGSPVKSAATVAGAAVSEHRESPVTPGMTPVLLSISATSPKSLIYLVGAPGIEPGTT